MDAPGMQERREVTVMSGRGEGRGMESARTWLRGVLVVVVVAALTGVLGGRGTLKRVNLSALNIAGIAVMIAGLAAQLCAPLLMKNMADDKRDGALLAIRLGCVGVCGIGAIMVFI